MSHAAFSSGQVLGRTTTSNLVSAALATFVLVSTAVAPAAAGHFLMSEPAVSSSSVRLPPLHTTMGFRRLSTVGQTKPPGAALDWRVGTTPRLDAQSHRLDQLINTSICSRC